MKAAVVHSFGVPPSFAEFIEPEAGTSETFVQVHVKIVLGRDGDQSLRAEFDPCPVGEESDLYRWPLQDSAFWYDDWSWWTLECCLFRNRCFGGVKALHNHFCDWCIARELVPCTLETFTALLVDENCLVVSGVVSGLVLRKDIASCEP